MKYRLLALIIPLLFTGCTSVHFQSPHFPETTPRSIAILPFEMIFTGNTPKGMTYQTVTEIEEGESLAFQASLYDALLDESGGYTYFELQPIEKTNRKLGIYEIGIRESWDMASEELAEILGVDSVVRTQVVKARYLSDGASFAVELGSIIADHVSGHRIGWAIPYGLSKTHEIHTECSLFDGYNGSLLWEVVVDRETDWRLPPNQAIDDVNHLLAGKFPY